MEFLTQHWDELALIVGGVLVSDLIGLSKLKANSVIELAGNILSFLKSFKK